MPRLPLPAAALGATLAGLLAAHAPASASAAPDPCPRSAALRTGPADGPYYATVAPFEHFSSSRAQVFPATCATTELPGAGPVRVRVREAHGDYLTPYSAVTRDRGQLYLYGYRPDAARQGAYVAAIDTRSLRERWRTRIPDAAPPGQWSYPGVVAVHGNGSLYAVYGNVLVRLDARTGAVLARRELPEDPQGTGAAYNGLIVLPDGRIAVKGIVVSHDTTAGRMAALHLDPRRGFTVRWRRPMSSLAFSALVGAARDRQIVIPDHTARGDEVLWLDERTGRTRARTRPLSTLPAPGNIVTPGFGDRFYFPTGDGRLWELHPVRARDR
jgi:hypothetical protein